MIRMMLFILIPFASISQEPAEGVFPLKNGSIYYERIVTADSISKNTLYSAAKFWALDNFNSQKEPLQIDDKESGIVAG